jgi:hypothetical protein
MDENSIHWDYVILSPLSQGEKDLSEIYDVIDEVLRDGSINRRLFDIEPRWGARPKYFHTVRSTMSSLRKRGMVERVWRGRYRITAAGRRRLEEVEP